MTTYDIKVDSKGRLLLPRQIRNDFKGIVRIIVRDDGSIEIKPNSNALSTVEFATHKKAEDLAKVAWDMGLSVKKKCSFYSMNIIEVSGRASDIASFSSFMEKLD